MSMNLTMGEIVRGIGHILENIMDNDYIICNAIKELLDPIAELDCSILLYEHCDVKPGNIYGTTCTVEEPDTCRSVIPGHYGISHLDTTGSKCLFVNETTPCGTDSCIPVNGYNGLCSFIMTHNGEGCNYTDYIPAVTTHDDLNTCQWSSIFPWYLEI